MSQELATSGRSLAKPTRQLDIRAYLQSDNVMSQVSMALPKGYDAGRFLRIVVTQVNSNPKLAECDPQSILLSVMKGAAMGIECDGRNGHLIPRWNSKKNCLEAQFQADYKGLVGLVRNNPNVADVYAELVRDADICEIVKGLKRDLTHKIDIRKPRGEMIGAYAVVLYKDGSPASWDFMLTEEILAIRDRSDGWKAYKKFGNSCPWLTDEGEMSKKTVLRRLLKLADLSADTRERIAKEDEEPKPLIPINVTPGPGVEALPEGSDPIALEEGAAEPAQPQESAPQTHAVSQPQRRTRKPTPPAAQEPTPSLPSLADQVRASLKASGVTEEQFMELAHSYDFVLGDAGMEGIAHENLEYILNNWDDAVKAMKEGK